MSDKQLNPELAEARAKMFREQMDAGTAAADKWWDEHRFKLSLGFFAGFITKLFALMSVGESQATMRRVFDTIRREVDRLINQTKQ